MRRLPLLMAVLVLFAGCASPEAEFVEPQITVTDVEDEPEAPDDTSPDAPAPKAGGLKGTVLDEIGSPVQDAHVALLGTSFFDQTQDNGTFLLTGIAAGTYTLRVDHPDFPSVEDEVTIEAGKRLVVEIVLVAKDSLGPGYRPHVHDHWGSRTEVRVVDQTVTFDPYVAEIYEQLLSTSCSGEAIVQFLFDEDGQIVYPGTRALRLTITWDVATSPAMRFVYQSAGAEEAVITEDLDSGQELEIPIEPTDWDSAHQSFSLWQMYLCRGTEHPRHADGDYEVKLDLLKDPDWEAGFDAPHPRFWNDTDRLTIVEGKGFDYSQLIHSTERPTHPFSGGTPYLTGRFTIFPGTLGVVRGSEEGILIPPGTSHLEATLTYEYGPITRGTAAPWSLSYRPADVPPHFITPADLVVPEPATSSDGARTYIIPLEKGQADGFYQARSNWMFFLNLEGQEDASDYTSPCYPCNIDVRLDVVAVRDATSEFL